MTSTRSRSTSPTAAARIASGGVAVSLTLGMVGLIAVRAAADENTAKEKALRTTAQENSPATTQATAAVAAERARSDTRVAQLRAEYEASLKQLAKDYQAKLNAAVPQEVVTVAGEPDPVAGVQAAADGSSSSSGSDSGSSSGYDPYANSSSGGGSGGGYDPNAGSSGGGSSSGSSSSGGGSSSSGGGSSAGGGSSSGGGAAPQAPAVSAGS